MANEHLIRLGIVVCALGLLLALERLLPWRRGPLGDQRWFLNAGLAVLGSVAVLFFEVLLNAAAMFNHAAVKPRARLEPRLRLAVVTPEMHCTHHSEVRAETDSCFGFCLPWWDRLFGSYRAAPAAGDAVVTGVKGWRDEEQQRLDRPLQQPARSAP